MTASEPLRVVAVIAAFNEGRHIREVVLGTRPHVDAIVVVDDGSTDDTAAAAEAAGAEVVRHPGNRGKGIAVRSGLDAVRGRGFTHVLLMDGDLQHRPSDVPRLVAAATAADADVIVGARSFDRAQMPASRYWSNVIGSWALGGLVGVPIRDTQSGFRLIRLASARAAHADVDRLRDRDRDVDPARPPRVDRPRSSRRPGLRRRPQQAPPRPRHDADLLPRPLLPFSRP